MPFIERGARAGRRAVATGLALLAMTAAPVGGEALPGDPAPGGSPTAPLGAADPAARMLAGDAAGEYWDVRARFEGGAYFVARFWVTNEGPGAQTGVAMGSFLAADGGRADFRYGRERSRWTLAGAGLYVEIASAVLDLRPPVGRVELDTNRQGIKVYLRFPIADSPPALCARRDQAGGFDVLALAAPIDGLAWTKEMGAPLAARGTIDVTHGWDARSEIELLHRRIEIAARDDDVTVYASVLAAPDGTRRACAAVMRGDTLLYESRGVAVDVAREGDEAYPVPVRIAFTDPRIELVVEPQRPLLGVNPLEVVPQPFRSLLGLRSRPWRTWSEGTWHLRLAGAEGRAPLDRRGGAVTEVSYTNPWDGGSD
jgi:hypothetical protein